MSEETFEVLKWILGSIGGIAALFFAMWLRVESAQNKKLDKLDDKNEFAHNQLHKRINSAAKSSTTQHGELRDKIDKIWQHLLQEKQ